MAKLTKASLTQFLWFNAGGVAFFVLGYGAFVVCYGVFGWPWWLAKLLADGLGWIANYFIQRYVAFRHEAGDQRERAILAKFSIVSLVNITLDYALVGLLNALGISPYIGLWISSLFFTALKYVQYRFFVFRRAKP